MAPGSLLTLILLMFIGASPGSTGGGMKTTTLGVLLTSVLLRLRGRRTVSFGWRQITEDLGFKAVGVLMLFLAVLIVDLFVLTASEKGVGFLPLLFESASALGNTGLSMGITAGLSAIGKIALSLTMFVGRVGPLTLGLALMEEATAPDIRYPEANILVG
jgi:trk system potassium uptake protein TrkH